MLYRIYDDGSSGVVSKTFYRGSELKAARAGYQKITARHAREVARRPRLKTGGTGPSKAEGILSGVKDERGQALRSLERERFRRLAGTTAAGMGAGVVGGGALLTRR